LIWIDRTGKLRRGALLAVYVVGYLVARLWLETIRIDPATEVGGVRINIWMSIIGIAIAGAWLVRRGRRPEGEADDDLDDVDGGDDDSASDDAGGGVEEVEMTSPEDGAPESVEGV
ncbi:MAG: prolipoprotein diacylglyceryl transferase family protein, partial [Actinomycetota bacterium]